MTERAVFDTNVLISALLLPGAAAQALESALDQGVTLLFTDATFEELASRAARPKFDRYRTAIQLQTFLGSLVELGEWVTPQETIRACRDADDDKFLELAVWGRADQIVTGDKDLLVLNPFRDCPILTPRAYLERS